MYMLWFNFILPSNKLLFSFVLRCGNVYNYDNNMMMSFREKKINFNPTIKLNHNIHSTLLKECYWFHGFLVWTDRAH